jgi:hypothetical protein
VTANRPALAPTRPSALLAVLAGVGSVVVGTSPAGTSALVPLAVGGLGLLLLTQGLLQATRNWLAAGAVVLVGATALAAFTAADPLPALGGVALAFVAWDCGEYAVGLGEQVGRRGATLRQELRNAGANVAVAVVAVGVGWTTLAVAPGGVPVVALVVLAAGLVLLFVLLWT